jgi:hypothetical protein
MEVLFRSFGEGRWFGLRVGGVRRLLLMRGVAVKFSFMCFRLLYDLTEAVWS